MSGFDNPLQTWNARYGREDYHFGEAPNAFLRDHAQLLAAGQSALCVADGEGRNSVFLAERGVAVTAFDFSPVAVAKAQRLAAARGVTVDFRLGDIYAWDWTAATYDAVIAIFIQFMSPGDRDAVFAGMKAAVKPGGLLAAARAIARSRSSTAPAGRRAARTCIRRSGWRASSPGGTWSRSMSTTTRSTRGRATGACRR